MRKFASLLLCLSLLSAQAFGGGSLLFDGTSGAVNTRYTQHAIQRSYAFWFYVTGNGGGGIGRFFDKRDSGDTEVENFQNNGGVNYIFVRAWSSSVGQWTLDTPPSTNAWHHFVITYDGSAVGNHPFFYLDGVSQPASVLAAPTGTNPTNNVSAYWVGNRGADDRAFQGNLADFRIYNVILSTPQVREIYRCFDSPAVSTGLAVHLPLWDYKTQYNLSASTGSGAVTGNTRPSSMGPPLSLCNGGGG